jgi:Anti-sigma factor NepR
MSKANKAGATISGETPNLRSSSKMQEAIGRSLKAHYADLIHAPIPDKFFELLTGLEAEERRFRAQSGEGGEDGRS